jgi:hypothetical protein
MIKYDAYKLNSNIMQVIVTWQQKYVSSEKIVQHETLSLGCKSHKLFYLKGF